MMHKGRGTREEAQGNRHKGRGIREEAFNGRGTREDQPETTNYLLRTEFTQGDALSCSSRMYQRHGSKRQD